nr:pancreatic polypeptide [Bos taurus]
AAELRAYINMLTRPRY